MNGTKSTDTTNVTVYVNSLITNDSVAVSGLTFSIPDVPLGIDGYYQINVSARDAAGNVNTTNSTVTLIVDAAIPQINFTLPTPANGALRALKNIEINVSIIEQNLQSLIYNWNGTNYTIYNSSLLSLFNFENTSSTGENSTYFVDVSPSPRNLTCSGAGCPALDRSGKYGNAFNFDGNNDIINTSNANFNFTAGQVYSVGFWIKPGEVSNYGCVINLGNAGDSGPDNMYDAFLYFTSSRNIKWGFRQTHHGTGNWVNITSSNDLSFGNWSHVIVINNGSRISIYINGSFDSSENLGSYANFPLSNNYLGIGSDGSKWFNGSIDEVRIWNRSLSSDEVYQQYVSNLQKFDPTQWYLYVNQGKNATAGLDDGIYTYQTFAADISANQNATEVRQLIVDVTPPAAPATISHTDDAPPGYDNDTTVDISWSSVVDAFSYRIYRNGVFNKSVSGTSTTFTEPEGIYGYNVSAVDTAGNEGARNPTGVTVMVDITPPTAPLNPVHTDEAPAGYDNDNITNISWSASVDATSVIYRIYRDGTLNDSTTSTAYGFTGETEGSHTYNISAEDPAGNINATNAGVAVIVDYTAPVIHNVSLSQTSPVYGQMIIVSANVTDMNIKNVTAVNTSLTYQSGMLWNGTITAGYGTNAVTVTAYDHAGNNATNSSVSYTGQAAPTSGSEGGGGSGTVDTGVISTEPNENIEVFETRTNKLSPDVTTSFSFISPEIMIYQVLVTGKENVDNVALRVEMLKGQSAGSNAPPPGIVYGHVNIFAGTNQIREALVKFKIENRWLEENKIASGDIRLVKWKGEEWVILNTRRTGTDDQFSYFEGQTDSFSSFAITAVQTAATPIATATESKGSPSATVIGTEVVPTYASETDTKSAYIGDIWLGMTAICLLVFILWLKRR